MLAVSKVGAGVLRAPRALIQGGGLVRTCDIRAWTVSRVPRSNPAFLSGVIEEDMRRARLIYPRKYSVLPSRTLIPSSDPIGRSNILILQRTLHERLCGLRR